MKKILLTTIAGLFLTGALAQAETVRTTNEYIDGTKDACQSYRTHKDLVDKDRLATDEKYAQGVKEGKILFSNDI